MNDGLKIGLDLDGVIIDHVPNKLRIALGYGYRLSPMQASSNFMHDFMPRAKYESLKDKLYGEETLSAPPVEGSVELMARLPGEVYIVSARRDYNRRYAWDWMMANGVLDFMPRERVRFVSSSRDKLPVVAELGLDVYMDDQIRVLEILPSGLRKFLLDPYGDFAVSGAPPGMDPVSCWSEFVSRLQD